MRESIPEIEVKFQKKTYTSRAGLKPISRFTKWFGMRELVESHLYLPKEARKYSSADLICSHLAMRCAGLQRISQSAEIANDPLVLELAGVSEFPSEDTLYDTLHRFAPGEDMYDEGGIRRLCSLWDLHEACVGRFLRRPKGGGGRHAGRLRSTLIPMCKLSTASSKGQDGATIPRSVAG